LVSPYVSNGHTAHKLSFNGDVKIETKETPIVGGGESDLKFMAGVMKRDRVAAFERLLWRLCHGKVYIRTLDIEDDLHAPFVGDYQVSERVNYNQVGFRKTTSKRPWVLLAYTRLLYSRVPYNCS
jgi:hypothetical protein